MAGAGYRDWSPGDVPTAAQFDTFLQEQTVMVFANAAARDTALSVVKAEGMRAFLKDTNTLTVYSGSAWSTIGPEYGALTSWTPTVTQSGSVTVTNTYSRYQRVGRMITGWFSVSVTGSGTSSNAIIIGGLPVTAATSQIVVGNAELFDFSAAGSPPCKWQVMLFMPSTTTFDLRSGSSLDNRLGIATTTIGLASGDTLMGSFHYEAAADA